MSEAVPPGRRSLGIYLLALLNLLLGVLALCGLEYIAGAQAYALKNSPEIGADLEAALAGLGAMRACLYLLAGGFGISALAVLSLTRAGFGVQVLWAALLCLTLVGLPYGLPTLVFLLRSGTRARFRGASKPE